MLRTSVIFSFLSCWLLTMPAPASTDSGKSGRDGTSAYAEGRYGDAEIIYRRALAECADRPETARNQAVAHTNLGAVLERQDKLDEAASHFEKSWRIKRVVYGDRHPSTVKTLRHLLLLARRTGNLDLERRMAGIIHQLESARWNGQLKRNGVISAHVHRDELKTPLTGPVIDRQDDELQETRPARKQRKALAYTISNIIRLDSGASRALEHSRPVYTNEIVGFLGCAGGFHRLPIYGRRYRGESIAADMLRFAREIHAYKQEYELADNQVGKLKSIVLDGGAILDFDSDWIGTYPGRLDPVNWNAGTGVTVVSWCRPFVTLENEMGESIRVRAFRMH